MSQETWLSPIWQTLIVLIMCASIIIATIIILTNMILGPFWLLLLSLIVPITLVPGVILLVRIFPKLLVEKRCMKPTSEKDQLTRDSFRQRLSVQLETSLAGVLWVSCLSYSEFFLWNLNYWNRWDFKL